jgi:predicted  nucleic acid-binding Zn-ribbon protein
MKRKQNKYALESLPITQKTMDGIQNNSLIDGLKAIEVSLYLQDEVYEDQFKELKLLIKQQNETTNALLTVVHQLKEDVNNLRQEIDHLRGEIRELTSIVNDTRDEVEKLKEDVAELKRKNTFKAIGIRIMLAIAAALAAFRIWHGPM